MLKAFEKMPPGWVACYPEDQPTVGITICGNEVRFASVQISTEVKDGVKAEWQDNTVQMFDLSKPDKRSE